MKNKFLFIISLTLICTQNIFSQNISDNIKGEKYIYEFRDGTTIIGTYDKTEKGNIYIVDMQGDSVYLPKVMVAQSHKANENNIKNGEYWFPNLHPTRYFFAPSAIGLKQGEGYFHHLYWMLWQFQYGISDQLSFGGGTSYFGFPATLNMKYSGEIIENDLFFSAGWFWVGNLFWGRGNADERTFINMPYILATKGTKENNFSFGFGYNFADNWINRRTEFNPITGQMITQSIDHSERVTVNFGATFRTSRRFSFIAEGWIFNPKDPTFLGGPGIRYFRKINRVTAKNGAGAKTFDFQLLMSPEMDGVIPMFGASQKF